jgi:hypothetical protein
MSAVMCPDKMRFRFRFRFKRRFPLQAWHAQRFEIIEISAQSRSEMKWDPR